MGKMRILTKSTKHFLLAFLFTALLYLYWYLPLEYPFDAIWIWFCFVNMCLHFALGAIILIMKIDY
jgi:hypothetical protein